MYIDDLGHYRTTDGYRDILKRQVEGVKNVLVIVAPALGERDNTFIEMVSVIVGFRNRDFDNVLEQNSNMEGISGLLQT